MATAHMVWINGEAFSPNHPKVLAFYANQISGVSSDPQPEQAICHESIPAPQREEKDSTRISISIKSFRRRLLDPDNLAGGCKYFVDSLRYSGIIPGDRPDQIRLSVEQEKVSSFIHERTEIEICGL